MPNAQGNPTPGDPDYVAPSQGNPESGLVTANVSGVQVQGYTPAQANGPGQIASTGYTPTEYITPASTVQNKVKEIVGEDSPLMQQATRHALEKANQRGLINSSLAGGWEREAVISQALPIAQQDSAQDYQSMLKTADAKNAASAFEAQAKNVAGLTSAQLNTQVSIANAGYVNEARKSFTDATNRASLEKALADLQAQTQRYLQELSSQTQIQTANISANASMRNADVQAAAQLESARINQQTQITTAQLSADVQRELGMLDAQNRQLLQTNINASSMFNQVANNIGQIQANPNLDEIAKKNAIQSQINMLNEALKASQSVAGTPQDAIGSLNLGQFFQDNDVFSGQTGGQTGNPNASTVTNTIGGATTLANGVKVPASMTKGQADQMRIELERQVEQAKKDIPIWENWDWRQRSGVYNGGPNESERALAWFQANEPVYKQNYQTQINALNDYNRMYPA